MKSPPKEDKITYDKNLTTEEAEQDYLFRKAVEMEIEKKRLLGLPIARYDIKTKKAYLEYPDGSNSDER